MEIFSNVHPLTWLGGLIILLGTILIHKGNQLNSKAKIDDLQAFINQTITGGDSYPRIMYSPVFGSNDSSEISILLIVEGNHPLFDASFDHSNITTQTKALAKVTVLDSEQNVYDAKETLQAIAENSQPLRSGTYHGDKVARLLGRAKVNWEADSEIEFLSRCYARNGTFTQRTKLNLNKYGQLTTSSYTITKISYPDGEKKEEIVKEYSKG